MTITEDTTTIHHPTANLLSGDITKRAWQIRREAAKEFGVRIMFVSWKDCIKKARGVLRGNLHDIFGSILGSPFSCLNEYIVSPECPVAFSWQVLEDEGLLENKPMKDFYRHLSNLKREGKVTQNFGWFGIPAAVRPYSNVVDA